MKYHEKKAYIVIIYAYF